jgi:branched-chain amino acid transport system ATP-binding protein
MTGRASVLSVNGLSKRFGGLTALTDVSFDVQEGQIAGIVGPNGAGKTTLFNCLTGYSAPTAGQVLFEGQAIQGRRPHQICRLGVARTFQQVKPFRDLSVLENVIVGAFVRHNGPAARERALMALKTVGLVDAADYDAGRLGLAGLRKLEIARALATGPKLLLLDETLAGLTGAETQEMCSRIEGLRSLGITVLIIEHSLPVMKSLCSAIVVLNFGQVIARGAPEDVLAQPAVREAYVGGSADASLATG